MLTSTDYKQIHQLMERNPDFKDAIMKIEDHQRMLLSSVAHDAKNCLTLLSSSLQLFKKKHPDSTKDIHFQEIEQDVKHLLVLMKELSTAEFEQFLRVSDVDLVTIMNEIIQTMKHGSYSDDFKCNLTYDMPLPIIQGDKTKLNHAFTNLIHNAYDAMAGKGTLNIQIQQKDANLVISIIDNGCGIPPQLTDHIFEPYVTSKENGSGLGLAISKNIFESHGGTIQFLSNPEQGTTFTVTLPISNFEM